ncbi:MAG: hypothetical protein L0213_10555, partial [Candidatus Dadabacteria bacterium]|nr:hypothetical protein [Candidatus Dadabacteria bacterium]
MGINAAVLRAFVVWLVLMGTEVVNGILRSILLSPRVGEFCARQIGVFTGSLLILIVVLLLIGWVAVKRTGALILIGFFWLVLTIGFELGLGRYVLGYSWERIASD